MPEKALKSRKIYFKSLLCLYWDTERSLLQQRKWGQISLLLRFIVRKGQARLTVGCKASFLFVVTTETESKKETEPKQRPVPKNVICSIFTGAPGRSGVDSWSTQLAEGAPGPGHILLRGLRVRTSRTHNHTQMFTCWRNHTHSIQKWTVWLIKEIRHLHHITFSQKF